MDPRNCPEPDVADHHYVDHHHIGPIASGQIDRDSGLRCEDKPFRPWCTLRESALSAALHLPLCGDPSTDEAIRALAANLIQLDHMDTAEWIFYSRDDHHYAQVRRYVPAFYGRRSMAAAVDRLEVAGLIEHQKTRPSRRARFRSRLRPTDDFRAQIRALPATATVVRPREVVVLRRADGLLLPYRETATTRRARADVMAHNTFLQTIAVTLEHPDAHYDPQGYLVIGGARLLTSRSSYHRIFNGSFGRGGRWYGPWWQNVPSRVRAGLRLNNEPTVESDIRGCHMRLLCAIANIQLGLEDPYEGLDLPRSTVKLAINVMLNAPSWRKARGALIERLSKSYDCEVGVHVDLIRAAIQKRFPSLQPFWNTGYGLVLQNIDADICARVQRILRDLGVPALSVHDSFIVPRTHHSVAVATINREFERACRNLRARAR